MRKTQSRARPALLGLALLVIGAVVTACGAPSAPAGTPAPATAAAPGAQATAPAATQPAVQPTTATGPAAAAGTAEPGSQEPGASVNLNPAAKFTTHYKGDPNAKVVIIEVSDFQ
jgi:protein-disulfide isomerase